MIISWRKWKLQREACWLCCDADAGNVEQLKTLVDELKILIHIRSHLNILNVLGAVTQDLGSLTNGSYGQS